MNKVEFSFDILFVNRNCTLRKSFLHRLNVQYNVYKSIFLSTYGQFRTAQNTPQSRIDMFVFLCAHTGFILYERSLFLIRPNCFGSLELFHSTNSPIKNFPTKGFSLCKVCLCYTSSVEVFFYCENPFHSLSFGLKSIFIKVNNFCSQPKRLISFHIFRNILIFVSS